MILFYLSSPFWDHWLINDPIKPSFKRVRLASVFRQLSLSSLDLLSSLAKGWQKPESLNKARLEALIISLLELFHKSFSLFEVLKGILGGKGGGILWSCVSHPSFLVIWMGYFHIKFGIKSDYVMQYYFVE